MIIHFIYFRLNYFFIQKMFEENIMLAITKNPCIAARVFPDNLYKLKVYFTSSNCASSTVSSLLPAAAPAPCVPACSAPAPSACAL
jgi:hypothetical protein